MNISSFNATISGKPATIVRLQIEQDARPVVRKPKTHYILMIDRSGSMYAELDDLLDQVNETIGLISSDDILSLIWYSGPSEYEIVLKGAVANSDIKSTINKLRRTVGSTCFSDPLKAADEIVKEFASAVDQTSLILFTDGQPVVRWSVDEEEKRSKKAVETMKQNGLAAMTCIGYGNYYNRRFLLELADMTDHGKILHNSRIDEFLETFRATVGAASDLVKTPIHIELTHSADFLYMTEKEVALSSNSVDFNRDTISANRNNFYLISYDEVRAAYTFGDESKAFTTPIKAKTPADGQLNFFYAYASKLYYYGKRKKALEVIVENCRDKYLAEKMVNAFTNDEVSEVQKALDDAVFDTKNRYLSGKCSTSFLPKRDALCVMDIFKVLFESKDPVFYLPFSKNVPKYNRIGKKVEDTQNAFKQSDLEVKMPLTDLSWAKDKLNLNVLISIPGTVTLNAKAAKSVGLPVEYPAKIYNNRTFVKDGTMNIESAEFEIGLATLTALNKLKAPVKEIRHRVTDFGSRYNVILTFKSLPIINQTYIDESNDLDVLYDLVKSNMELEAKIRVVKSQIDDVYDSNPALSNVGIFSVLTSEQVRVLSEHGVSDKGVYNGIERKVVTDTTPDSYEIRILEFSLAGYKTIPAVKAFKALVESKVEPKGGPGQIMYNYHTDLSKRFDFNQIDAKLRDSLQTEKDELQAQLSENRQKISMIKMSKILNNDFFDNLKRDDKGVLYYEKDLRMNVKSERKMLTI